MEVVFIFAVAIDSCFELLVPPAWFRLTGDVRDRPHSGRPMKTTPQAGRYARRLSAQAIWNRLHAANPQSHRAARHRQACLRALSSNESRFLWRRHRECYADCCTDRATSFGGGSVMVVGDISLTGKTRVVINADRYQDKILQPVEIPYLHSSILQNDNARRHRAVHRRLHPEFGGGGVERMGWAASSPDLNPNGHMWDQACCLCQSDQHNHVGQMLVEEGDAISLHRDGIPIHQTLDENHTHHDPETDTQKKLDE
uniref:Uncharacterized protein n=1 Tax=Echeneis naucrates TaxID=173247 RepID=A0A665V8L0_ECHNA